MAKGNMMGGSPTGNYGVPRMGYPGGSMGSRIPFRPNMPPGPGNVNAMPKSPLLGTGGDPYWSQGAVQNRGGNTGVFGGPGYGSGGIGRMPIMGGANPGNNWMAPGMMYPGGSARFDERTGRYRTDDEMNRLSKGPLMGGSPLIDHAPMSGTVGRMPSPYQPGNQMPRVPMTNPQPIQGPGYGTGPMAPQFDMNQILQQIAQRMGGMQQMGGYGR